jgi:hypothetical protein
MGSLSIWHWIFIALLIAIYVIFRSLWRDPKSANSRSTASDTPGEAPASKQSKKGAFQGQRSRVKEPPRSPFDRGYD